MGDAAIHLGSGNTLARHRTVRRSRLLALSAFAVALASSADAAAIVDGESDETSSIVSIGPKSDPICSGTVIGRRLVVTAAHCVTGDVQVNVGDETLSVAFARVHPEFDESTMDHDIALLVLAEDAKVDAMPVASAAPSEGERVRFVGFGRVKQNGESKGRRAGFVKVDAIEGKQFKTVPDPATACGRDSGGAVLDESGTQLVGVISAGDAKCEKFAFATRLDVHQSFIDGTLSGMESSGCSTSGANTAGSPAVFAALVAMVSAAKRRFFNGAPSRAQKALVRS